MNQICFSLLVVLNLFVKTCHLLQLDFLDCGAENETESIIGNVDIWRYPWLGVLYYPYDSDGYQTRAIATVVLVHREFVLGSAADIGPMPKHNFRRNTRVLVGESWQAPGRRVRSYVIHPEYGDTINTLALVQLKDVVQKDDIRPICPPPTMLVNPAFVVVKFKEDYNVLQKQAFEMAHTPANLCKEFYVEAGLDQKSLRPKHSVCAVQLDVTMPCIWNPGAALVSRDQWGRWQLLGFGVRGPGCGAPSRYIDMFVYYDWIKESLQKYQQFTVTRTGRHTLILRSSEAVQRFGACDEEELTNLVYRDNVVLNTDHGQFQTMNYNLTILQSVEYSCMKLELINASASSEMSISHICPRSNRACYNYKGSKMHLSVSIVFSDSCIFDVQVWGHVKNMSLLDIQEWKWEEGVYYNDFNVYRIEYRGPYYQTGFGYEPADEKMWTPEYSAWFPTKRTTTTILTTTTTSTPRPTTTRTTRSRGYHTRITLRRGRRSRRTRPTTTSTTTRKTTTTPKKKGKPKKNTTKTKKGATKTKKGATKTKKGATKSKKTGKDGKKKTGKDGTKKTGKDGTKKTGKDGSKKTGKGGSKKTDKGGSKKTDKGGSKKTDKGGSKKTDKGGSKKTDKGGSKKTDKGGSKKTADTTKKTTTKKITTTSRKGIYFKRNIFYYKYRRRRKTPRHIFYKKMSKEYFISDTDYQDHRIILFTTPKSFGSVLRPNKGAGILIKDLAEIYPQLVLSDVEKYRAFYSWLELSNNVEYPRYITKYPDMHTQKHG